MKIASLVVIMDHRALRLRGREERWRSGTTPFFSAVSIPPIAPVSFTDNVGCNGMCHGDQPLFHCSSCFCPSPRLMSEVPVAPGISPTFLVLRFFLCLSLDAVIYLMCCLPNFPLILAAKIPERVNDKVVVDGNVITSQGPATAMPFALQVMYTIALLGRAGFVGPKFTLYLQAWLVCLISEHLFRETEPIRKK